MSKTLSQELLQLAVALRQDRILDSEVVMVERAAKLLEFAPASPSQVLVNALRDPDYAPYCMTAGCMRMAKVGHLYWRCACGSEHDGYLELEALLADLGFTRNGYARAQPPVIGVAELGDFLAASEVYSSPVPQAHVPGSKESKR